MADDVSKTPVLFLIFDRPDTTVRVFEAIRRARPPRLYVAADGPRAGREGEEERCSQVRKITEAVDWPCEVKRLYRDENLGCKLAVSSAITWFFDNEEEGIILEDDCLPDRTFFPYCEAMLERFRNDERVMMVAGSDYAMRKRVNGPSYYFVTYFPIWGWATWRRAWKKYDISMSAWPELRERDGARRKVHHGAMARWLDRCFELTYQGRIDTWDYQWAFACLLNDGLAICPRGNLISNIGLDGAHMRKETTGHLMELPRTPFDASSMRHPRTVAPDRPAQRAVYRAVLKEVYPRGMIGRLDQKVYRTWQRIRGRSSANGDRTSER